MKPILEVREISKKYNITHEGKQPYLSLRDSISNIFKRNKNSKEEFWALRDINFDVYPGDSIAIIGRNGAGKSTLLKILSKITSPSGGKIISRGRIASLLEVGTGFHQELTGRENIYLNGSILGLKKREIEYHFDAIIDFSGVEKFLDTPLKHYSSGMQLRLAFAVAAHLEPEILIIDEVLAVGDSEFQKKCLGKMDEVSKSGRTILFVSHNMGMVSQLCKTGILISNGRIVTKDKIEKVTQDYINTSKKEYNKIEKSHLSDENQFSRIFMANIQKEEKSDYNFDEEIILRAELYLPYFSNSLELALRLIDANRNAVFTIHEKLEKYYKGNPVIKFDIIIPGKFITPGKYSWIICINHPGVSLYDLQDDVLSFTILETGSEFARYNSLQYGSIFAKYSIKQDN